MGILKNIEHVGRCSRFHLLFCVLQRLTLEEKMQKWNNVKLTARIMGNPMATFAACGLAYATADCATQRYLGREDPLSGVMGGVAVGVVLGLKQHSVPQALGYAALFAGGFTCLHARGMRFQVLCMIYLCCSLYCKAAKKQPWNSQSSTDLLLIVLLEPIGS